MQVGGWRCDFAHRVPCTEQSKSEIYIAVVHRPIILQHDVKRYRALTTQALLVDIRRH